MHLAPACGLQALQAGQQLQLCKLRSRLFQRRCRRRLPKRHSGSSGCTRNSTGLTESNIKLNYFSVSLHVCVVQDLKQHFVPCCLGLVFAPEFVFQAAQQPCVRFSLGT
ncbi:unnamed protein product [Effrenium voratum]|uniref:Uncharacterized protein n=1 Tax=Effrenium voratum TaxID=2562239 RepID=A0AA36IHC2_9DINO|nr:unnamed protein product [Effrenium voratum]